VNWNRRFEEKEMDRDLADRLIAEKEGILLWCLIGAGMLVSSGGFQVPEDVDSEQKAFMATVNPLLMFVDECCVIEAGTEVRCSDLYDAYTRWIDKGRQKALGRNNFYSTILSNYPTVTRGRLTYDDGSQPFGFRGIRLREGV